MYHSEEIIRQLQSQKILAMKLDRAVRAVGEEVKSQLSNKGPEPNACCTTLPALLMNITMYAPDKTWRTHVSERAYSILFLAGASSLT